MLNSFFKFQIGTLANVLRSTATPGCSTNSIPQPANWKSYYGPAVQVSSGRFDFANKRYCSSSTERELSEDGNKQMMINYLVGLAISPEIPSDVKVYAACKAKRYLAQDDQIAVDKKIDQGEIQFLKEEDAKAYNGITLLLSFWPLERVFSGAAHLIKTKNGRMIGGAIGSSGKMKELTKVQALEQTVMHLDDAPQAGNVIVELGEGIAKGTKTFCMVDCSKCIQSIKSLKKAVVHKAESTATTAFDKTVPWLKKDPTMAKALGEPFLWVDESMDGGAKLIGKLASSLEKGEAGKVIANTAGGVTREFKIVEGNVTFYIRAKFKEAQIVEMAATQFPAKVLAK